jgi:hypothetical protein
MKHAPRATHHYVLGVFPNVAGFGWALFEGPLAPIEWGVVEIKKRARIELNAACLARFRELVERFSPSVLVLEQFSGAPSRRSGRIRSLCRSLLHIAEASGIEAKVYSRAQIGTTFAPFGAKTRRHIAVAIASQIDSFEHLLPPIRKIWNAESPRMGLFNAAALAITYYWDTEFAEWPTQEPA